MATSKMEARGSTQDDEDAFVYVFDRRSTDKPEVKIQTGGLFSFQDFKQRVAKVFEIGSKTDFVITTTNREEIKNDDTWDLIDKGNTLYILRSVNQELCAPAQERVNYLPHYDTIVKGGMYEYYASEGQNPLPYAFAELIDNALAATANNLGPRRIHIRLHLDEQTPSNNCIVFLDNGKGMTPRQLNNWAIYRLSKFIRRDRHGKTRGSGDDEGEVLDESVDLSTEVAPRYMNSDISYFGVGGKQAIFFIGNKTRMITKPPNSTDVHELMISKDEFEQREKNNESIYSGFIYNRKPGESSHIKGNDSEVLKNIIREEVNRDSFTAVVIQGINTSHIPYLKHHMKDWCRQLAHIYHFYLHGPNGNVEPDETDKTNGNSETTFNNIHIEVSIYTSGQSVPKTINLRDVNDDMQSLYIRNAAECFNFKAMVDGSVVEGEIRYHPFMFDHETYPSEAFDARMEPEPEDDHGYAINDRPARGRRPMFECYWNGRLIPYTLIQDFDWCTEPKKIKNIPAECYNRVSGVLWTSDKFQVSTNKLTFLDLEMKLRDKSTTFFRTVDGHERRTMIQKEYSMWLKDCHEQYDKQILFTGFKGVVTRADMPKQKQFPWSMYEQIDWDGRTFKKGQLVRILRTLPTLMGTIKCFLLYGDNDGDVYSTGGDIELYQEPRSLYDEVKIVPLSKLDRSASQSLIRRYTDEEETKLPDHLVVTWPEGQEVVANEKRFAGKTIGAIKVEIANKKGEYISKLPGTSMGAKKLLVELKVIWHSGSADEVIVSHISQHGKNWPYWFRKMENIKNLGAHTLNIQTVLNESGANMYAGRELPSHKIRFHVIEAEPEKFSVGVLDGPFRVGAPFQIPIEMLDRYNHVTKPNAKLKPVLQANGLELSYTTTAVKGNTLILKDVVAIGSVPNNTGKNYNLSVKIADLEEDSQTMKIRLLPGQPNQLRVKPDDDIQIENGHPVTFYVEVLDVAGNITTEGKQILLARFTGSSGMPSYSVDVSKSGCGNLTGDVVNVKKIKNEHHLTAKVDIQGHKDVKTVERRIRVVPSSRVAEIEVFREEEGEKGGERKQIRADDEVVGTVGRTIEKLSFRLIDEAGREITITDKLVSKVKVNWVSKTNKDMIYQGILPDIKIPSHVNESKYCLIHITDGPGIEFDFTVRGAPDEASQLRVVCTGKPVCSLGEQLPETIHVMVKDKHNNDVTSLMTPTTAKELKVSSKNLCEDKVKVTCEERVKVAGEDKAKVAGEDKVFCVRGLEFKDTIGHQEVEIAWRNLSGFLRVEVCAGAPAKISLLNWEPEQPVVVYSESKLPPIKVQIEDSVGNPCKIADIKVNFAKDSKLTLTPTCKTLKTNSQGMVDFGVFAVSAETGVYDLQPKAFLSKGLLSGPRYRVSVQVDPTQPSEIQVNYKPDTDVIAGNVFPDFSIKVLDKENCPLTSAMATHLSMKYWCYEDGASTMPSKAVSITAEPAGRHEKGVFYFRKQKAPERSGKYNIMFVYFDKRYEVFSNMVEINVLPGQPTKLVPADLPGTLTVSNTSSSSSRLLIKNLKLFLQDNYGNKVSQGCHGKVTIHIEAPESVTELPTFLDGTTSTQFKLESGVCHILGLYLQEKCPGKDGLEYTLSCRLSLDNVTGRTKTIPACNIPFLFYNDAKKQSQMATLSKQRDELKKEIRLYKSTFEMQEQLVNEIRLTLEEASKKEQMARNELRKQNISDRQLTPHSIQKLLEGRVRERDQILQLPRRMCGLAPGVSGTDVLGKIGHLAMVDDSDIARVLSWHMSADMDCIVTHTSKKAKEIYRDTGGRQQVLPLDSIYRRSLPDWSKPLPHVRHRPNWNPQGNPRYARDMLVFPKDEESCKIVFGMLLGDTLILDSLDDANTYRQEIVRNSHCPTILTVQGDRIRSNGKFGGTMNKALPIEKLRGAVFSQSLPMAYHALCTQIDMLTRYKECCEEYQKCKQDLQEQLDMQKLPEMTAKYKECEQAENKLKTIEQKLGVGLQRGVNKHPSPLSQYPSPKRLRLSDNSASLNSSNESVTGEDTPTRTSKRIASMTTVVTEDGRKRLRKT